MECYAVKFGWQIPTCRGIFRLHLQARRVGSGMLVFQSTRRHIPDDRNLNTDVHGNLKSHMSSTAITIVHSLSTYLDLPIYLWTLRPYLQILGEVFWNSSWPPPSAYFRTVATQWDESYGCLDNGYAVTWPFLRSRWSRARTGDHCRRFLTVYMNVGAKFVVHFLGATVPLPTSSFNPAALTKLMEHYGAECSAPNQQPHCGVLWIWSSRKICYPEDEIIRFVWSVANHVPGFLQFSKWYISHVYRPERQENRRAPCHQP